MKKISEKDAIRFWQKVEHSSSGCWLWLASRNWNGYGTFSLGGRAGKPELAHRVSFAITNDVRALNLLHVCHRCDTPACVNPAHLFLGTQSDNISDAMRKGRLASGERAGNAKITEQIVREIRASSASQRELAARYGLDQSNVSYVRARKTWRHV